MGSRNTAVDYLSTAAQSAENEVAQTIRELVAEFGTDAVAFWSHEVLGKRGTDRDLVASALRRFCIMLADSERPKLTAILVGKLVGMDTVTKRVSLRSLAREYGISPQAVHNHMKLCATQLNLPRLETSETARQTYALTNRRNYGQPA